MKKKITTFILAFGVLLNLQAQLKLNVEGPAAIQGNLNLGNPEANITGLDMLGGFNDLRFSADDGLTEHMRLTDLGYLGIGITNPDFKLHVYGESQTALGLSNTSTGGRTYSIYSLGISNSEGAGNFMIRDESTGNNRFFINTNGNIGIGTITPDLSKLHVVADANSKEGIRVANNNSGGEQIGIITTASGSGDGTRIGLFGRVNGDAGTGQQYGVYGLASSTNASNITIGVFGSNTSTGTGTYYAGYFNGDATVTGTFSNPSDENLKKNIRSTDKAIDRLMALNPVSYEFRTRDYPQMKLAEGPQMGFIAQEVETIFPELVKENMHPEVPKVMDKDGNPTEYYPSVAYKGLNYTGLIPVLTRAAQEQQEEIADLEAKVVARDRRISDLEARLAQLEHLVQKLTESEDNAPVVPISDASLLQNQPNPFTQTTRIHYHVPASVNKAELQIADAAGRVLKTIIIDQRGEGQTTLRAQSLSAGTYFYSLILDGAVQHTKKMVITNR